MWDEGRLVILNKWKMYEVTRSEQGWNDHFLLEQKQNKTKKILQCQHYLVFQEAEAYSSGFN